jgi:hypothetical protein
MGIGGLKEAGIALGPDELQIGKLIEGLQCRPADEQELHKLDAEHKDYNRRHGRRDRVGSRVNYGDWYTSPFREEGWRLLWYSAREDILSETTRKAIQREEGKDEPDDWIWSRKPVVSPNDWVLCVAITNESNWEVGWLYVDRVFKVPTSDKLYFPDYPYEVVQLDPLRTYSPPPFLVDRKLKQAFKRFVKSERIRDESASPEVPTKKMLSAVYSNYMSPDGAASLGR